MSCGVGCRISWDLALLWLWCRPEAIALIKPLAWKPPYAAGHKDKRQKKKKKKPNNYELTTDTNTLLEVQQVAGFHAYIYTKSTRNQSWHCGNTLVQYDEKALYNLAKVFCTRAFLWPSVQMACPNSPFHCVFSKHLMGRPNSVIYVKSKSLKINQNGFENQLQYFWYFLIQDTKRNGGQIIYITERVVL